jgi:hypothetical protein
MHFSDKSVLIVLDKSSNVNTSLQPEIHRMICLRTNIRCDLLKQCLPRVVRQDFVTTIGYAYELHRQTENMNNVLALRVCLVA